MNVSIFSQWDHQVVLSFNKYITSLTFSTCTLTPRSKSQVILTSIYSAKKVTALHDLVSVSLSRSSSSHFSPRMCAPTNFISFRPSNALCCLTSEPFTVLSVCKAPYLSHLGLSLDFIAFGQPFLPVVLLPTFPNYQDCSMSFCVYPYLILLYLVVSYTKLGTLGGQQLGFRLAQSLYHFCLEPC